ncbi:peroxiredoxin-2 isoform X1 [Parasteatoda tepidariorum]|uniref:thioredoxin-dependent peroxiredoxin n=1 Tax=Parasteatoda tepidariorum TaxID=114398 RepID=A0A2L2XWG5_PARTP|nr:peroxiredoxin-2 isoform X1 [Parasteatoda tepidariorum]XP_015924046.1 peroxiredoxin-2 isoform X1 [Parasteatoda tepidariorum]XP_015924047.1 peroxiredoxin-2 isoform X1 [Parasteatoda tepidariorum]
MAPELTKPAPDFQGVAVINGAFKDIKLSDYEGKYLVLFFYPLDFTFVCPTEIIAFSDRVEEFKKINCEVVACSTDSHFSHLAWINTPRKEGGLGKMNIPLLADKSCKVSKAYGVYKEDAGITFRGLFIIDEKQNLRQITMNDLPVGRSVDETLRLVQAFQFTDKHGEGNKSLAHLNEFSTNKVKSVKRQNCDELVATIEAKKRDCYEEKNITLVA